MMDLKIAPCLELCVIAYHLTTRKCVPVFVDTPGTAYCAAGLGGCWLAQPGHRHHTWPGDTELLCAHYSPTTVNTVIGLLRRIITPRSFLDTFDMIHHYLRF